MVGIYLTADTSKRPKNLDILLPAIAELPFVPLAGRNTHYSVEFLTDSTEVETPPCSLALSHSGGPVAPQSSP